MEAEDQKALERVVSQKALKMSTSFPCQICVAGFLSGVCLASLLLAALTSIGSFGIGGVSFPTTRIERDVILQKKNDEDKVSLLYSSWSTLLDENRIPRAPHLENCRLKSQINNRLDKRTDNQDFPPWTSWRGSLDLYPLYNDEYKEE